MKIAMNLLLTANDEKVRGHVTSQGAGRALRAHGRVKLCSGCCCVEDQNQLISPECPQGAAH